MSLETFSAALVTALSVEGKLIAFRSIALGWPCLLPTSNAQCALLFPLH